MVNELSEKSLFTIAAATIGICLNCSKVGINSVFTGIYQDMGQSRTCVTLPHIPLCNAYGRISLQSLTEEAQVLTNTKTYSLMFTTPSLTALSHLSQYVSVASALQTLLGKACLTFLSCFRVEFYCCCRFNRLVSLKRS